jgi:hypothetical protein
MEHKFTTLFGHVRSMLNHAKVQGIIHKVVLATPINFAIATKTKPVAPYMLFYSKEPKCMWFLKTFGEVGIVLDQCKCSIKGKLKNHGKTCMFTCYAKSHTEDIYIMLNPETNCILKTRDVLWLKQVYMGPISKTTSSMLITSRMLITIILISLALKQEGTVIQVELSPKWSLFLTMTPKRLVMRCLPLHLILQLLADP